MTWMETEREALVQTLRGADPDAPTLCEGWSVRHLLAHLVEREQEPARYAADMAATRLGREPGAEPFLSRLAGSAVTAPGYAALVDRFAGGGSPLVALGDRAHLVEYVVHHEDVRRAGAEPAEPRVLTPDLVRAVWQHLGALARTAYRSSPVGVVLVVPGGPRRVVRRGADAVVVSGDPVEQALFALGRREVADVEILGAPGTVARFEEWADLA